MSSTLRRLENSIAQTWCVKEMGRLVSVEVEGLVDRCQGEIEESFVRRVASIHNSIIASTLIVLNDLGTAEDVNLKSIKTKIDSLATLQFDNLMNHYGSDSYIASSEAKDEYGNKEPVALAASTSSQSTLSTGLAVDVVDGTTLAALGLPGAYSIAAIAGALRSFPDLQAYAVMGPKSVLTAHDFDARPEDEVFNLIRNTHEATGKRLADMKVLCHSSDTGNHHEDLIRAIEAMGVTVVVPEPVIVEPPFTIGASASVAGAVDLMIGVFGLPEIVINTLLVAAFNSEIGMRFRVASNGMMKDREARSLDEAFAFTDEELEEIARHGLEPSAVHSVESIAATDRELGFVAVPITNDEVLGISGVSLRGDVAKIRSTVGVGRGAVCNVLLETRLPWTVSGATKFSLPISDLSLVAFVESQPAVHLIDAFAHSLAEGGKPPTFVQTDSSDLHVTLLEYHIDYNDTSPQPRGRIDAIASQRLADLSQILAESQLRATAVELRGGSVRIVLSTMDATLRTLLESHLSQLSGLGLNTLRIPEPLHITIGHLTSLGDDASLSHVATAVESLEEGVRALNWQIGFTRQSLVQILRSPFHHTHLIDM